MIVRAMGRDRSFDVTRIGAATAMRGPLTFGSYAATALVAVVLLLWPGPTVATTTLAGWMVSSADDLDASSLSAYGTLSGDDALSNVTLPFSVVIEGTERVPCRILG